MNEKVLENRRRQVLYDKKWIIFLKKTWVLRHIPFIEFTLAAGSMALGNVHKDSDFDVIIAARPGKIFTSRFFSVLFFSLLGWRRKKLTHHGAARDKICLNHFITKDSYRLSPPYNKYWKALYVSIVPLYGAPAAIDNFFLANEEWLDKKRHYEDDLRHRYRKPSLFKQGLEFLLTGKFGDWFERVQRKIQVRRIENGLSLETGYKPRIIYNDKELEFHPDTARMLLYK